MKISPRLVCTKKLLDYLGLIMYQIDITFVAPSNKLLVEIFVEIESTIIRKLNVFWLTNFLDCSQTSWSKKKRKMKNKISAFSLDFLSIGPSINGTPSDELLVLDLKKGQDCISSSALPVPISNRGHLHPFLGRYIG